MRAAAFPELWNAVLRRDRSSDGAFVYAVRSTGVFCRPSCPSRRPRRERVEFFATSEQARDGGYRACRRCRPDETPHAEPGLERLQRICRAIAQAPERRWTARALASVGQCSAVHVRRTFQNTLGVTPREYASFVRRQSFLSRLRQGDSVTTAIHASGYGSSSRAYAPGILPGMTLATYGKGGAGASIAWATIGSPLGRILVAATGRGLCFVEVGDDLPALVAGLRAEFPLAAIDPQPSAALRPLVQAAAQAAAGKRIRGDLPFDIRGTAFQWRVWRELTRIPLGETITYAQLASRLGAPKSVRAVARACATNPVALIVPCHRVIGADGNLRGFRWGLDVKEKLIAEERKQGEQHKQEKQSKQEKQNKQDRA